MRDSGSSKRYNDFIPTRVAVVTLAVGFCPFFPPASRPNFKMIDPSNTSRWLPILVLALAPSVSVLSDAVTRADEPAPADPAVEIAAADEARLARGREIYTNSCAACHGERGQGVPGSYEPALVGDRSIAELSGVISETMPEGNPEACVGEDAEAVSRYIFEAFYSEAAQSRLVAPRAALARLTANQYRQSVADLFAHFMGRGQWKSERGLNANYFDHPGWKNDKKVLTRVDPNIDVQYGQASPGEGMEPAKFAVYWSGSLYAPESGSYRITARGQGSFIVKFIDTEQKFFDNHVSSGEMAEHTATVDLVGGRLYPLSVDLIKRERKTGNVDISMTLAWKTPKGVEEPIPTRYLIPSGAPTAFAPQTPMPPDDRSAGYVRGSTISREWDDATTRGSLEFADAAVSKLWPKFLKDAKRKSENADQSEVLRQFLGELVSQAVRRPLDDPLRQRFVDAPLASAPNEEEAIRRVVLLTLKSPRFLYPALDVDASPSIRRASRLALTLWDSLPDAALQSAAGKGELENEEAVRQRARAMLQDPRARAKILAGLHEWLDLARWEALDKNTERYPGFDAALVSDLRTSLDLFLEEVVWSETSDFRQFLQADWAFTSDRIAVFYGDAWKPAGEATDGRFARTGSDPALRAGVITHPFLMSALAYGDTSSPIFRGVFLLRHILGRIIRVPNEAFTPLNPDLHPGLTTRERVALQTGSANCQGCHQRINGMGFALEGFDAVGRVRTEEHSKPIDASGVYVDRGGAEVRFESAADLTRYLATSDDVVHAFVNRMFLHMVKQPVGAFGENRMEQLKTRFRESGYHIRELLVEMAVIAAEGPVPVPAA
jgi:mono/diheme cytochrome c family protein